MKIAKALSILAALLGAMAAPGRAQNTPPGTTISQAGQLLSDTRNLVFLLKGDMTTLDFFASSEQGTKTYASILNSYAAHISTLRHYLEQLGASRKDASHWQQIAMDRMIPVMKEMASSAETAITAAKTPRNPAKANEYQQYFKTNSDLADELSTVIAAWADYAKTRDDLDRVTEKLGLRAASN